MPMAICLNKIDLVKEIKNIENQALACLKSSKL
jgi:hypothetical protein